MADGTVWWHSDRGMLSRTILFSSSVAVAIALVVSIDACTTQSSGAQGSSSSAGDPVPCRNAAAEVLSDIDGHPCEVGSGLCEKQDSNAPCSSTTRCTCDTFGSTSTWHCASSGPAFSCGQVPPQVDAGTRRDATTDAADDAATPDGSGDASNAD